MAHVLGKRREDVGIPSAADESFLKILTAKEMLKQKSINNKLFAGRYLPSPTARWLLPMQISCRKALYFFYQSQTKPRIQPRNNRGILRNRMRCYNEEFFESIMLIKWIPLRDEGSSEVESTCPILIRERCLRRHEIYENWAQCTCSNGSASWAQGCVPLSKQQQLSP
ncbi:hypothetical protein CEXT_370071 [Caerostris extrusa]|uniref:Uncharacterized protein n=1 Tax=Caerostris extrusa TaxID=172846 RepID=A0AAV4NDG2_CAEEX|nr:hypothetical protein CEXT_370071 [Caerostris extrusa]